MLYSQFCPVAKAAEIIGERWTLLILRELVCGTSRFNDLQRSLRGISSNLLTKRLKELESAGMLFRRVGAGRKVDYIPTPAGDALKPVIIAIGEWGMNHARGDVTDAEMDLELLMWDIRRTIVADKIPGRQAVLHFRFHDQSRERSDWWIEIKGDERELCTEAPAGAVSVSFRCDAKTLLSVWLGDRPFNDALTSGDLNMTGEQNILDRVRQWLGLSVFASERMGA